MRLLVVGNDESATTKVRQLILRNGFDQRAADVTSTGTAGVFAGRARYELAVFLMPGEFERGLTALRELRSATEAFLLAVGPADDPKRILRVLREGVSEYLDERELENELEAALIRFKVGRSPQQNRGRVVGVLAPSGGSGSSTVAANLATALAGQQKTAMLLDLRLPTGDQALLFDVEPDHTLADVCRHSDRMDQSMLRQALIRHRSGVHLLAGPNRWEEAEFVHPDGVRRVLGLGRTMFRHLLVDLDRTFRPEQVAALALCDTVLLVIRLDMTCLRNSRRTLDRLAEMGISADRVIAVVNRYGEPKRLRVGNVEKALGIKLPYFIPNDPARVNSSVNKGVPVVLERPRAKISKSIVELALYVNRVARSNGQSTESRRDDGGPAVV